MKTHDRYYTRSSSFYMAVTFAVLCGLTVIMLAYFGYFFARGHFVEGTEAVIDTEIKYINQYPDAPARMHAAPGRLYARFHADGTRPADIPQAVSLMTEGVIVFDHPVSKRRFAAKIHTDYNGQKTLVGADITDSHANYNFMMALSLAGIIMVAVVIAGSFAISVFVVRGTNDIASTARDIMVTGDLSRRIVVRWRWDDLSNMADTLNMLFDRIEQLMRGVRHVSDNIAHDLRTPLARMKAPIDELARELPGHPAVMTLSAESDRMLAIFNALLRISRLESEKRRSHFQTVNLADIIRDAVEFYEPAAEEKSIRMSVSVTPATISGDRDLLFQAFANILDNAVKYTPAGGTINVAMKITDGRAVIDIADTGPGLPEDDLARIFDRFYRSDASRTEPGTGLGLSLAEAIIDLHGGQIRAENRSPGLSIITVL